MFQTSNNNRAARKRDDEPRRDEKKNVRPPKITVKSQNHCQISLIRLCLSSLSVLTMDSATSATGAGSKLLKLQARKQKIQLTSPSAPISPLPAPKSNILPLRGLQYSINDSVDGGYPFMMGGIESISTNDYLVRIKEENEILMHLLNVNRLARNTVITLLIYCTPRKSKRTKLSCQNDYEI